MSDDMKKCPYCGGEIKIQATKCKHCKQFIPKEEQQREQTKDNNVLYKVITVSSLVFALSIGALYLFNNTSVFKANEKSLIPQHELIAPESSDLTVKEVIEQILAQDNMIREVLSKKLTDNDKDKAFSAYLDNVQYYVDVLNEKYFYSGIYYRELDKLYDNNKIYIQNVEIIPIHKNYKETFCGKINSFKVDTIGIEYGGEGTYNVFIDYQYLYDSFSSALSVAFKDYLRLMKEMSNIGGIESEKLDAFRERYPKFIRKNF